MYTKHVFKCRNGQDLPYLKYTPHDADSEEKMPLLIFMHGAGERGARNGTELELVAKHGPFKHVREGREFPFVIVAPQCPKDNFWWSYIESLNAFLDQIIEENNIDTDRIYLTGLSMGGTASWLWATGYPERFAAIAPVCGEAISWCGAPLAKKPVRTFHGDCDDVVSPHQSLSMVANINKHGGKAEITVFPGVKHNAWDYAYNDELYSWFLRFSLKDNS